MRTEQTPWEMLKSDIANRIAQNPGMYESLRQSNDAQIDWELLKYRLENFRQNNQEVYENARNKILALKRGDETNEIFDEDFEGMMDALQEIDDEKFLMFAREHKRIKDEF